MNILVIEPSNEADYRLFLDIAKRLNVPYRETSQPDKKTVESNSSEGMFFSLYGAFRDVSADDMVKAIENARTSKEITVALMP